MIAAKDTTWIDAVWQWYTWTPPEENRDALIAIAGVAVVVWTGGLVALTFRRRFTLRLSNGFEYVQLAYIGPLFALVAHGALLRTVAVIFIFYYGIGAIFHFALARFVRYLQSKAEITYNKARR